MKVRGFYWIVPALAAMWWFICLVGLLALWAKDHHNHFSGTATVDGVKKVKFTDVVYISDIGAEHQHYFIAFCVLTAAFYIFTVLIERSLRHERHIPGSLHIRTSWFDSVSLFCAVAGSIGLIMLSIFNTFAHGTVHWSMTALFIVGALLSVLFQTIMLFDLSKSHDHVAAAAKQLLWPAIAKCCIFVLAIIVAIAFACLYMSCHGEKFFSKGQTCNTNISAAAGCEWTIAFLLVVYLLMYCYDFWPARKDSATVAAEGWTTKEPVDSSPFGQPFHNSSSYYVPQPSVDYRPMPSKDVVSIAQSGQSVSRYMPSPRAEEETKLDMESSYSGSPAAQWESPQPGFAPHMSGPQGSRRQQYQQQYGRSPLSRITT